MPTAVVVIMNVALVAPEAIVTPAGTAALELLLERATTAPPAGAAPVRVTVPVELAPPYTTVGERAIELSTGGTLPKECTGIYPVTSL